MGGEMYNFPRETGVKVSARVKRGVTRSLRMRK